MPDFEQTTVTAWLTELRPEPDATSWPPAIRALETEADTRRQLVEVGRLLDEAAGGDLERLGGALRTPPLRGDLTIVLAQLGAARVLRLLHFLSESGLPDCDAVIRALLRDDTGDGRALRAAIGAVTRRATLRRMFAPERIAALEAACTISFRDAA